MNIVVVGSGYVGLVAAACFAELGHSVTCVDNDVKKVVALRAGQVPIHEEYLPELLARHHGTRLTFSDSLRHAMPKASVIFVAVGTPAAENGEPDLSYVEVVAREIGSALDGDKIIVEKSTVPVYTCERMRRVINMTAPRSFNFEVASNPEFLREGTAITDFMYPDRIVIGADSPRAAAVLRDLYEPLTSGTYCRNPQAVPRPRHSKAAAPLVLTTTKNAELIKHASNAFLAMKISFINAIANLCEAVGADISQVREGIGLDSRIGLQFLHAGIGYGGSCFPKDVSALSAVARECGYDFDLLTEVIRINNDQRQRFVKKVRSVLWNLRGKKLAVLGLAFKGGTDDVRDSPAIDIIKALLKEGCSITAYDPVAGQRAAERLGSAVSYAADPYVAAEGCDALLILTDWPEFASLDLPRLNEALKYPLLIDGRNLYHPDVVTVAGFVYASIGRPIAEPQTILEPQTTFAIHTGPRHDGRANAAPVPMPGAPP